MLSGTYIAVKQVGVKPQIIDDLIIVEVIEFFKLDCLPKGQLNGFCALVEQLSS
ncbi:hypothetical protein D029_0525 [Vibrio parahaemolyticus 970107]|nr:hypothetical protein D029_0525 [Vibrio parahaemolyticus 970107]